MTKISLIRHGLVHNPAEVYYGRLPGYGLAALGRAQAAAAGDYLAGAGIVAVYHSPMLRAFQTAEIVRSRCAADAPLVECDLLNEIHSPFDGLAATEMEKRDWNFYDEINPPYEQPADIVARLLRFFDLARQRHPGHHVIGVSHADPIAFAIGPLVVRWYALAYLIGVLGGAAYATTLLRRTMTDISVQPVSSAIVTTPRSAWAG